MSTGKKALIFLAIVLVAGGVIALGVYNATKQQEATGIPRDAIPVQLESPHRETIVSRVSAKGSVELRETVTLYPETQARISLVHIKEGDAVNAGDLLVTYDAKILDTYRDQLAEAELALASAELSLASAFIPASSTELLQAEAQISQARKVISDIETQVGQIFINISQIEGNIETATLKRDNTQSLYELGIVTKTEMDNASETLKSLENQKETIFAQLNAALADKPMAEENLRLAQAQYNALANRLTDPKTVNQQKTQELAVEQAKLRISQIQKSIDDFIPVEYAPAAGTVLTLYAAEGDMASSGRALMAIADTSLRNLVIRIFVPEGDAKNIAEGQSAEIKGAALGTQSFPGHVGKIHPLAEKRQLGNTVETVLTVEIVSDDPSINLRAGYTVETSITTGTAEDTVVVPLMATLSDADGVHFVYLMQEDYTVEKRPIILGEYAGIYVQAQGVAEHERIILNPSGQIKEGVFVKPILQYRSN
jgi:multidrug efflux pump subunit AcrA (membrane-fusion protein)